MAELNSNIFKINSCPDEMQLFTLKTSFSLKLKKVDTMDTYSLRDFDQWSHNPDKIPEAQFQTQGRKRLSGNWAVVGLGLWKSLHERASYDSLRIVSSYV